MKLKNRKKLMPKVSKKKLKRLYSEMENRIYARGCHDLEDSVYKDWTEKERKSFVKKYHQFNGDPEEYDPKYLHIPDFAVQAFLRFLAKIKF